MPTGTMLDRSFHCKFFLNFDWFFEYIFLIQIQDSNPQLCALTLNKGLFLTSVAMYINVIAIYSILQCHMFWMKLQTDHIFEAVTGIKITYR